ncbi:hypothetical protein BKA81DRAFT_358540 [Phyllosticta paracitricarpa]
MQSSRRQTLTHILQHINSQRVDDYWKEWGHLVHSTSPEGSPAASDAAAMSSLQGRLLADTLDRIRAAGTSNEEVISLMDRIKTSNINTRGFRWHAPSTQARQNQVLKNLPCLR